jgi:hypothetical protein
MSWSLVQPANETPAFIMSVAASGTVNTLKPRDCKEEEEKKKKKVRQPNLQKFPHMLKPRSLSSTWTTSENDSLDVAMSSFTESVDHARRTRNALGRLLEGIP